LVEAPTAFGTKTKRPKEHKEDKTKMGSFVFLESSRLRGEGPSASALVRGCR
jgi:hypothetical protein